MTLLLVQGLNGLQLGVMLFLLAAGLTLVFGIMNLINLAHGSMYMLGAYLAATIQGWTDSFVLGVILAVTVLAVLPFANLSPDQGSEYFSDGLTEELIYALGRGLEQSDKKSVRAIGDKVAKESYRFSSLVLGIVQGEAFQTQGRK